MTAHISKPNLPDDDGMLAVVYDPVEEYTHRVGRCLHADGGYRGNPEVIIPYRKPADGTDLPAWKEALNVEHRTVRAGVEHALARMTCFTILRDYRRAAHTLADAASGTANLHNIILAG
ncbi:transposase family protein [Micromonospora lutea]|uniref:DDE Tnp4 domain-containing protein n=1 Tax=Micromonospora lutea TaxID=419825 RepID=A0ABQ4J119_9ACTN|nr:hypothetical protein Vlu01_45320 [Micromonospora lutea]